MSDRCVLIVICSAKCLFLVVWKVEAFCALVVDFSMVKNNKINVMKVTRYILTIFFIQFLTAVIVE